MNLKKWPVFLLLCLLTQPAIAAKSIYKERGTFDSFRQFTSHFEFSVPQSIETVRPCVLNAIGGFGNAAPESVLKLKKSNKKGVSVEKYTWPGKYGRELTFTSGEGWSKVDTDNLYAYQKKEGDGKDRASTNADLHAKCGLIESKAFPPLMPHVLAYDPENNPPVYTAYASKNVGQIIECLDVRSEDIGPAWMGTTLEADHTGAFYLYYIQSYKNLGATIRLHYATKVTANSNGSKLEIVMPGVAPSNPDPALMEREFFPAKKISACGGVRTPV
jgi:hypothetical protein